MDIEKYLLPIDTLDLEKILSTWTWLTADKFIVGLTKAGDALLSDKNGDLYFLDAGLGSIVKIAENWRDFFDEKLNEETTNNILLVPVIDRLKKHGVTLKSGQVYSFTILPILGGTYDVENIYVVDIYEHYNLTGDIHFQLKDLSDGSQVDIRTR